MKPSGLHSIYTLSLLYGKFLSDSVGPKSITKELTKSSAFYGRNQKDRLAILFFPSYFCISKDENIQLLCGNISRNGDI